MTSTRSPLIDDFDIGIETQGDQLARIAADFSTEVASVGLRVRSEARPSGSVMAGLEWVMPTAAVLFLANKYLGTLLTEAAKDHYPVLKAALQKLVRRTTGTEREVTVTAITTSSAKVSDIHPATFSVWVLLRDSRRAVFRFDHSLSTQALDAATEGMFDLLTSCTGDDTHSTVLGKARAFVANAAWAPIVLRFDPETNRWRAWILDGDGRPTPEKEAT